MCIMKAIYQNQKQNRLYDSSETKKKYIVFVVVYFVLFLVHCR